MHVLYWLFGGTGAAPNKQSKYLLECSWIIIFLPTQVIYNYYCTNVREKLDRIEKSRAPANQQIEQVKFAPWINCKLVLHYQFHYVLPTCPGFKLVSCETCSVSTNEWAKKWKRIRSDSKKARRRQGTVGQPEQVHKQTHPGVIGSTVCKNNINHNCAYPRYCYLIIDKFGRFVIPLPIVKSHDFVTSLLIQQLNEEIKQLESQIENLKKLIDHLK